MTSNLVLTPNIFQEGNNKQNIISILKDIISNPIFITEYQNTNWSKTIQSKYVSSFEPKYKDKFQVLIRKLKDEKKLIKQTNHNILINSSEDWINVSKKALNVNLIDFIITDDELNDKYKTDLNEDCESINNIIIDDTKWDTIKNKRSSTLIKTESNMEPFLSHFMPYSSKLIIIDPYFQYQTKNENFLKLCSRLMGNRSNFSNNSCRIEIHTRFDSNHNYNFQTFLTSLKSQFNHTFIIYIWDDSTTQSHKFHDRFLITESIGFSVSHSFDITYGSNQETTWSFLDKETKSKHISNFQEQDPLFVLKNKIEV